MSIVRGTAVAGCLVVGALLAFPGSLRGGSPQGTGAADRPAARADPNSLLAHAQLVEKARTGRIDVYFVGDSITRRWGATDYPELLAHWTKTFFGWNAANFGWGADRTENILWRLENGELDGVNPKVIVVLAGTNNVGAEPGGEAKVADATRGVGAILETCRRKAPGATIIVTAIFPRNDNPAVMPEINRINANIARLADGRRVRYLDVNGTLADQSGRLFPGMTSDGLHPTLKGYQVWAEGLRPILTELLGPPGATDHAPPPTGDPSAIPHLRQQGSATQLVVDGSPYAEEGRFSEGGWENVRWLGGDETHQGRHVRLESGRFSVQRVKLYNY